MPTLKWILLMAVYTVIMTPLNAWVVRRFFMKAPSANATENAIAKYSKDYDASLILKGSLILSGGFLVMLFITDWFFRQGDEPKLLTEALIHTIAAYLLGLVQGIGLALFNIRSQNKKEEGTG